MPQLQVKHRRDSVAPLEKLHGVRARNLVGVRHDDDVAVGDPRLADERIDGGAKDGFHSEGGVRGFGVREGGESGVEEFVFGEIEAAEVAEEEEGFGRAGEGGVGFEEQESVDEGEEGAVADLEEVELVAEENGVEDAARGRARGPTVEATEKGE